MRQYRDTVLDLAKKRKIDKAAHEALAEAEARRKAALSSNQPAETGGRGGLEPTRYGDWEIKGLTSDF